MSGVIRPLLWETEMFTLESIKSLYKVDAAGYERAACDSGGSQDAELSGQVIQKKRCSEMTKCSQPKLGGGPQQACYDAIYSGKLTGEMPRMEGRQPSIPLLLPPCPGQSPAALVLPHIRSFK